VYCQNNPMLFHVQGEWIELGHATPPQHVVGVLEGAVIPSLRMLAQWQDEGQILAGGVYPGERAGAWIFEAGSASEMGSLLSSLPFWGMMKWTVRALQSTQSCAERELGVLNNVVRLIETPTQ
jgi:hypothetical protein